MGRTAFFAGCATLALMGHARAQPPQSLDPRLTVTPGSDGGGSFAVQGRRVDVSPVPRRFAAFPRASVTVAGLSPGARYAAVGVYSHGGGYRPPCAGQLIRVYRVADGALAARLPVPWEAGSEGQRVLTLAFDERAGRVAALVRWEWGDCDWEGAELHLFVWRVADGRLLERRRISRHGSAGQHRLELDGDRIHVTTRRWGKVRSRTLTLRSAASP